MKAIRRALRRMLPFRHHCALSAEPRAPARRAVRRHKHQRGIYHQDGHYAVQGHDHRHRQQPAHVEWAKRFSEMAAECGLGINLQEGFEVLSRFYPKILWAVL